MKLFNNISRFAIFFNKKSPLPLTSVLWFFVLFLSVTFFDGIKISLLLIALLGALTFDAIFQHYLLVAITKKSNYSDLGSKFSITILMFVVLNVLICNLLGFLLMCCLFGIALIFTIGMYFFY